MKKSQTDRLFDLLSDGRPHSTIEILQRVYGGSHLGIARISARIYDIKKKYGVEITCKRLGDNPALFTYQLKIELPVEITSKPQQTNLYDLIS